MQVRKRDGKLEKMNRNKLKKSILTAGARGDLAEQITSEVEVWAEAMAEEDIISSSLLWERTLELLETYDPTTAAVYKESRFDILKLDG